MRVKDFIFKKIKKKTPCLRWIAALLDRKVNMNNFTICENMLKSYRYTVKPVVFRRNKAIDKCTIRRKDDRLVTSSQILRDYM